MCSRSSFGFAGFCSFVISSLVLLPGAHAFPDQKDRDRVGKRDKMGQVNVCKASDVIGTNVTNRQGDKLGDIKEIVIDRRNGKVLYAVLSFGGFLGMGDDLYAIPWSALQEQGDKLLLDVDKDTLANAPGFPKDNWPDFANHAWGQGVHDFYGKSLDGQQKQLIVNSPRDLKLDDANLKRESTKLEVELDKGDKFNFRMTNLMAELAPTSAGGMDRNEGENMRRPSMGRNLHDDTNVEITIDEVADENVTMRVRFTPDGQTSQMFLVRATEKGDIVSVQPTSAYGAPGERGDQSQPGRTPTDRENPSTGTGTGIGGDRDNEQGTPGRDTGTGFGGGDRGDGQGTGRTPPGRDNPGTGVGGGNRAGEQGTMAGIEDHVRSCLQFIVGEKLHEARLQPGQTYATGTTLNNLMGTNGDAATSPSSAGRATQTSDSLSLRFEGTKEINGEECAVFTVLCSHSGKGSDPTRTGPGSSGAGTGADRGDQRGMDSKSMRDSGRVAYRLSDGLLESALVSGSGSPEKDGRIVLRRVKAGQQDKAVGGL